VVADIAPGLTRHVFMCVTPKKAAVMSLSPVVFLKGASWVHCEMRIEYLYTALIHQFQDKNGYFFLFAGW